jgi:hypothetical protein
MRWQETARKAAAANKRTQCFTGLIGDNQAHLAAVFGRGGVQQTADGVNGLAALADNPGQIRLPRLHGVDILAVDGGMGEEDLVRMAGQAAEDEVEEFLHGGGRGQAAWRAFLTRLRTVSDICAPFLTQWSMRSTSIL